MGISRIFLTLFVLTGLAAMAQQPQSTRQPTGLQKQEEHATGRIMTRTRLVSVLLQLERQLYAGIQNKDKAAITALLDDEFEIWTPNGTGDPLPLEDWLAEVTGDYNLKSFKFSELSARDFGQVVLFKCVLDQKAELKGKDESGNYFIVDAWVKNGDSWKLSDRYVSKVSATQQHLPVKPSGKE